MKVAELEGALLDYWVARAQEIDGPFARGNYCFIRSGGADVIYSPSGDWARGGPIIEHARIQIVPQDVNHLRWSAYVDEGLK
ncbi:DUF2591 family protein, partial [Mycobacterium tuberculosis]|nr:DUF2591 family protein [Mycobacterium tuberculosis]